MPLDRHGDKMIAERKGRTANHGKEAIKMALQRIASVAKILRKGAIVMLCGRSQLNENLRGDECILQQISALRRENRFLKVGLIFCLVLSALPYLTGFQPTVIRASKVVTERIEFAKDGKTVMSIAVHPNGIGLVFSDKDNLSAVQFGRDRYGGFVDVYNKDGRIGASIMTTPNGGSVNVFNNISKLVASMGTLSDGGIIVVCNSNGQPIAEIITASSGGSMHVYNKDGKGVASMEAQQDGGVVGVANKDGQVAAAMIGLITGGMIGIRDKDGKLIWTAP
jgi:hypothetical protein